MGGCGSGRNHRFASRTDEFHKLDLASFKREWFSRYYSGQITWSRGGHKTGSIGYRLCGDHMRLNYTLTREDKHINERFEFDFTRQNFGGERRWIICPSCGRRCRVLYGGAYFRCRRCYNATYESQYEFIRVPGLSSAERVRDKLGGEPGFVHLFPNKPKGMHWKTYRRLEAADYAAMRNMELALMGKLARWR